MAERWKRYFDCRVFGFSSGREVKWNWVTVANWMHFYFLPSFAWFCRIRFELTKQTFVAFPLQNFYFRKITNNFFFALPTESSPNSPNRSPKKWTHSKITSTNRSKIFSVDSRNCNSSLANPWIVMVWSRCANIVMLMERRSQCLCFSNMDSKKRNSKTRRCHTKIFEHLFPCTWFASTFYLIKTFFSFLYLLL